ncbi:MAG: hypothetical protein NC225_06365 [Clostridium sp.]|nr:hypothetical protein [Clostridium sp.]MCM1399092.1 hypothetical protein [Clostridium sp.]MCM1459484.1 hypothetical protein [Bacteroides sp.]
MSKPNSKYSDNDPYKDFFFARVKRTVYKWWCVVYRPVYKLTHHGYWPEEKEPGYIPPEKKEQDTISPVENKSQAQSTPDASTDSILASVLNGTQKSVNETVAAHISQTDAATSQAATDAVWDDTVDTSGLSTESVDLAKEIMERLAREAAEDEAKKQAEIDQARTAAAERERLEEIMRSNKVDISKFIEEGKASQTEASANTDSGNPV